MPSEMELTLAKDGSFRKALIAAAEDSQRAGEITRRELLSIRIASLNPRALERMRLAAEEQLAADKGIPVTGLGEIDWNQLLAFLKELIPVIIQIISLFS